MAISAHNSGDKDKIAESENMLSGTLKSLFALSESYPDLKATSNFSNLQNELTDTEDKIQASRRFYNSTVMDLNTTIAVFPKNILANILDLKLKRCLSSGKKSKQQRNPVEVKF